MLGYVHLLYKEKIILNSEESHPGVFAQKTPDRPSIIIGEAGESVSFLELENISNQIAHLLRDLGLRRGDRVAILLENHLLYIPIVWGAFRCGLRVVTIATHLTSDDVDFILEDSNASALFTSSFMKPTLANLNIGGIKKQNRFMLDGCDLDFRPFEEVINKLPNFPVEDQSEGIEMLYSSGTTGRPKGIMKQLPDGPFGVPAPGYKLIADLYNLDEKTVYLSPAPQYHAAPLLFVMRALRFGATVIIMRKFEAEIALSLIQKYKVTHSQWVPTMFIRMLALGDEIKSRYDQSSLKCVIHAAAPCPIEVKLEMIKWWGEIIWEYYGASEGNGLTVIDSKEWLRHRGSVGKAKIGKVRICGDDGEELPRGETGLIYFSDSPKFEYHNDPQKTKDSRNQYGWSTLGDIGYLDSDDYLYLTDRKANTIISGGVNIYPQEIENHLLGHPAVKDVAVIGTPNNEFGEEVKAVVIPIQKSFEQDDLERELIEFCLVKVGKIKSPKSVDFVEELPRQENGKLYKRLLKDRYWKNER